MIIFRTEYFENKYWMWKFQNKSNLIHCVQYLLYHSQSLFGPYMKQFQYIHVKNFSQGPFLKTWYTKTIKGQWIQTGSWQSKHHVCSHIFAAICLKKHRSYYFAFLKLCHLSPSASWTLNQVEFVDWSIAAG